MANVFSGNPFDAQLAAMGAVKPKKSQDSRSVIEGVATRYKVPANVLMALDEAAGGNGAKAEDFAKAIAAGVSAGKSVDAIIAEAAGDPARASALMNRAYDIADELYPSQAAPKKGAGSSVIGDLGRQLGGSIVKGGGSMAEGVGQGVDSALNAAGAVANPVYQALTGGEIGKSSIGRDAGVASGDAIRAVGDDIQSGVSPEGRQAMMDSTPDGDIFKPSTITLGKNPSLRGYAMLGADVLGSFLPVVATAVITKSPGAAAAVGGAMGGGAGAETARDIVQGMAKEIGPDGKSKLETESALYRDLVAGGASPEQALDKVTREAERLAFLFTTPISAFGGAATAKILERGATEVAKRGIASRVAGKAALSGLEEGIQEAAESMAARYGTGQAAQMPIDITEGTFGDFILGALGGAPVGAVAGIPAGQRPPREDEERATEPEGQGATLALPAPDKTLALPAPNNGGTIISPGPIGAPPRDPTSFERDPSAPRDPNTSSDGSGRGQAALSGSSPGVLPPVADGAAAPLGPVSAIAAAAPDLTPVPQAAPVEAPPMFSEMKPGAQIRLQDPDGQLIDAVFQREENGAAVVRIGGQEVALDPAAFDTAVQGARQADLATQSAAKAPKSAKVKPVKLSDQATATVAPRAPEPAMTPEQAAKAASVIEDKAAKEGWTKGLRKKYDNLIAIAGEAYSPKPAATPDVPDSVAGDSGVAPGKTVDPKAGEVTQASPAPGRTDPPVVATGGSPDNGVDGATPAGQPGNALTAEPRAPAAPATVDYPNRKMNMRKARAAAPLDGLGDMEDGSFGNIALANGREGDVLPGIGTISKVTDKQVQITKPDGSIFRVSEGSEKMNKLARDIGALIASSANLNPEQLGSLMDMIERDPALVYRDGVPMLFDDPAEQANRGQRSARGSILKPLVPKAETAKPAAKPGLLSALSQEKQDRAAFLQAKLAAKARNQTSSGLDPEYITLGGELVALYIEAGTKRFGQMLRDFAEATGLSMREAQAPMRAAYNHVRDDMDLNGEDITGMDSADEVMAEVRKALDMDGKGQKQAENSPAPNDTDPFVAVGFTIPKDKSARRLPDTRSGKEGYWLVRPVGEGKFRATKSSNQVGSIAIPTRVIGVFGSAEEAIAAVRADGANLPAPEVPTAKEVAAAATVTDPEPSKAQAEAENYRTGKTEWNGLTLSIENKKGGTRRGFKDDGSVAWEVAMPAHYGRILRTEGADGDHVDFYLGDVTDSDYVMIIDQVDAETGAFDEHKLILGTTARGAALGIYRDAFSDGKADKRIGGFTETNVGTLKAWLKSADMSKPSKPLSYPFAPKEFKKVAPAADGEIKAALAKALDGKPVTHITKRGKELTGIIVVNPMLVPAQAEAIDARAFRKTGDNGGGWFIRADAARAYLGEENQTAEETVTAATAQEPKNAAPDVKPRPAKPKTETLQKRPLIHRVRSDIGQIDPDGTFGKEAYARGMNAQTAPGLFKRGGLTDLDNIPADEHPEIALVVGRADDGLYLDQDRLLELMLEEISGDAQPIGQQAFLQQQGKDARDADSAERRQQIAAEQDAGTGYIPTSDSAFRDYFVPDPEIDIRAGTAERYDQIRDAVAEAVSAYDMGALTPAEIRYIVDQLDVAGGSVLAAVEQAYARSILDADQIARANVTPAYPDSQVSGPPFGPEDEERYLQGGTDGNQPVGADWPWPDDSGAGSGGQGDTEAADQVADRQAFEPGADGKPQAIMPGMEGGADQRESALTARQKAEIEARQKQSKMRRLGGNEGDAGPLFGDGPKDLFDAPATPRQSGPQAAPKAPDAPLAKITDFGEKIGGARKDVWSGFKEKMEAAQDLDIKAEPLSKSWPEPDYEKLIEAGIDPWTVSFVRAARELIPRKPAKSWKLRGWADQVKVLRDFASDLLEGRISAERLKEKLADFPDLNKKISGKIALYDAVGHGASLKDLSFGEHTYSMLNGEYFTKPRTFWEVTKEQSATAFSNMPKTIARGDTRDEAIAKFKERFQAGLTSAATKKASGTKFLIYSMRGAEGAKYRIGVKIGKNYVDLRSGIADVKEARRIVAEEADQLQATLDAKRTIPNERRDENAPRIGADHRAGADVSPAEFAETFGFRGVEFGNWVEQGRRKQDLNDAYDALMDLASILDIPPKAISLNGSLGLAFGARGAGGKNAPAAHFEAGKFVINLTKRSGRGSLAHEWFHALDNYFARKRNPQRGTFITDNNSPGGPLTEGVRPETVDAFLAVKRAIANTGLRKRSEELDKLRSSPYFGTGIEMHARAFESYIIAKLQDQSAANDYLANVVSGLSWSMLAEASGLGDAYPYLRADEIEAVRPKFDALFSGMERRDTDKGVALEMREDAPEDAFVTQFMQELAQVDDLFQNPVSKATTLKGVFADIDPSITYVGNMAASEEGSSFLDRAKALGVDKMHLLRTANKQDFYIHEADGDIWIDVSQLAEGSAGSRIYSAVADYALNSGLTFIGDPDGLSDIALRRRTDAMLSTALKHGTTKHIAPHPRQLAGDKDLGVPPLSWTAGNDVANLESLIEVSTKSLSFHVPEISRARYDFKTGAFRTSKGEPLTDAMLRTWSAGDRIRAAGAGSTSLKRSILFNSLALTESSERAGLLERALRQPDQLVARGLSRTFYLNNDPSRADQADAPITADDISGITKEMNAELAASGLAGKVSVRVVRRLISHVTGNQIQGRFNEGARNIEVRAGAAAGELGVMRHEIIHALRSEALWGRPGGLFTPAEWRELSRAAQAEPEIVASVMSRYPNLDRPAQVEEMVAELYRLWAEQRDGYDGVAKALAKVEAFLHAMANLLRGKGFVSAARTMEQIAGGKVGRRGPQGPGGARRGRDAEMRGDQVKTDTPSFKRWFGNSKAIDGDGQPMIVHHWTYFDFDTFDPQAILKTKVGKGRDPEGIDRIGSWFTSNPNARYASPAMGGKRMDVYLSVQKPLYFDDEPGGRESFDQLKDFIAKNGGATKTKALLRDQGYDSIVFTGTKLDGFDQHVFITFDPEQVKSVDNSGSFDPANPSIMEMRALPGTVRDKFQGLVGFRNWRDPKEVLRNLTTDAMTGDNMSVLALVPGRALFAEMGSKLLSTKRYIRAKEEMDTLRNDWHAKAAGVAQKWIDMQKKDPAANAAMMDLMHRSTMTGVDPSKADTWGKGDQFLKNAKMEVSRLGDKAPDWAKQKLADEAKRKTSYAAIKALYDALPPEYQAFYVEVKDSYEKMADDFDQALEENIIAGAKIALKRAEKEHRKTLRQIEDDGLTGADKEKAIDEAEAVLAKVRARANTGAAAQIKSMRKIFEGQRLKGPYFPLARFGDYFVTVRDEDGKVINFSRFESEKRQQVFKAEQEQLHPGRVSFGLMSKKGDMRDQVDPKFVSDVEMLLADSGASAEVMDAIWQRYLETMPDQSIRTSKIHRKGREGFNRDALRSYTSHTFHGAHQLARLKYGLELQDSLDDAQDEARRADDPNRATALVNEMRKRMDWTMNPTGSSWSAAASSLAFVWYLGVSPAAAVVNLTQTTVIGPSVMVAGLKSATYTKAIAALGRAAKDFGKGQGVSWKDTWTAENAPGLTDDERAAMKEGYRRGTIDKTQAHDLAAVAESGVEFNPFREKWMKRIGFAFHHAERVNREVTFLAAYRLARADGMNHADAIEKASDLTWKTHFSYQNSDRPRFMQGDIPKVLFIFRQFSVNLLYRLFRDAHQSLAGATKAERKEARTQLVGISLSMMAHAGIKGVWGYSLLMMLLGMFIPGADDDDIEEWMQDALLMEGDGLGVAAANYAMGAFLNGIPGQLTGAALTERVGSPNLWFRGSDRNLEGEDVVQHYINELAGPIGGIAYSVFGRGIPALAEGEVLRGVEALTPKFVRDVVRTGRYAAEGVTTRNGDSLIEDVNPWELILQANGFTPARVAERYDSNTRLKNKEREITDQRKDLHRAASDAIKAGEPIPEKIMDKIRDFNTKFPEYPITGDTIRQSFRGRMRASERNEFGVSLNPRLNDRLRGELAPLIYN